MPEPTRVMRLDVNEEEMHYLIHAINLSRSVVVGDWVNQIQDTVRLRAFLADQDGRIPRLNDFRVRIARLAVGDEMVEQALKDIDAEVNAKGYKKCPDCGGFHA